MTFYTSLSGLQAAQTDLSTISHNLANVSTNGFKKSRSEFADVMASNFTTDPRRMVGSGAVLKENRQEFGEGSLDSTGNSLDLAISGDGFFAVKSPSGSGVTSYTRNGAFSVDPDRYIADAQGNRLQAYKVESDGTVPGAGTLGDVRIPETSGAAVATQSVMLKMNLNAAATAPTSAFSAGDPTSYNSATSTTVYDAAGHATTLTNYFVRDAAATGDVGSSWTVYSAVGGQALNGGAGTKVTFDGEGNLTAPTTATGFTFPAAADGTQRTLSLDLAGTTGKSAATAVVSRGQDGSAPGEFSGITVDSDGVISASYANGDTLKLGKVALANFVNPTGLKQTGTSYWASTGLSGSATMGSANQNGFGNLMSGTIEGSNVDITEELVGLIAAQRNFQANAKALDTQSQISETIFNIRS